MSRSFGMKRFGFASVVIALFSVACGTGAKMDSEIAFGPEDEGYLQEERWRIGQREIDRRYRRLARKAGIAAPRGGSLMVIHRAGSDLKANLHFHSLFLDGCYSASGSFWTAPAPTPAEVERILARIIARAEPLFGDDVQHDPDEDEQAIEKAYTLSTRAERHRPEDQDPHDFGVQLPTRRKARLGQWDLDAEVVVEAHDRERLEHLCRYLLRPPLALDRLTLLADGKVCVGIAGVYWRF